MRLSEALSELRGEAVVARLADRLQIVFVELRPGRKARRRRREEAEEGEK